LAGLMMGRLRSAGGELLLEQDYGYMAGDGERVLGRFDENGANEIRQRVDKGLEQQELLKK
ncbi:MAG: hypothetical protein IJ878_07965, partial [Exiguobacterium sp.]|nr:hypothetical protein [Exiguobacterium sp.]